MSKARGPYRVDPLGYKKSKGALDKMAENARELGLDYELQDKDPDLIEQSSEPVLMLRDTKPNYNMTFHRDGKQVGVLDFNGPEMTFTGDADESAKIFFDMIARSFKERLEQERKASRKFAGLTDEEIENIFNNWPTYHLDHEEFARVIENILREKNS